MSSNAYKSLHWLSRWSRVWADRPALTSATRAVTDRIGSLALAEYSIVTVTLILALLLRAFGNSLPFAPTVGAFAGRGSIVAVFCMLIACLLGVGRAIVRSRWPSSWVKLIRRSAVAGITSNVVLTLILAAAFDQEIKGRIRDVKLCRGFVTIESPGQRELTIRPKLGGGFIISAPFDEIPPNPKRAFKAVEDFRLGNRATGGVDVRAILRAGRATISGGRVEGGSTIAETTGGLLFELQHGGSLIKRITIKIKKFVIGLRVGDLLSENEQIDLLATLSTFGSVGGNDVKGLRAASLVYYGKEPRELLSAEAAELASRLANPNTFSPYRRRGESEQRFSQRLDAYHSRVEWAIDRMRHAGFLSDMDAGLTKRNIFLSLVPREVAVKRLRPPFMKAVFKELEAALVWPSDRHVIVRIAANPETQSALEEAITKALPVIEARAGRRDRDHVVVDALAVNANGAIVARAGLWSAPSEQSSVTKVIVLALALERGLIHSLDDVVLDRTVRGAVETSHNETFNALVERLGPQQVAEALRRFGYSADVAHPRIGLGGGVTATLPAVAGMFEAFGYSNHLGSALPIRVVSQARDAETGETYITASIDRAFSERVAREVQSALEGVALRGTASRELGRLAAVHAIITKTGTSAYVNPEGRLDGRGGSWIVASDSATDLSITVRVRWASGEPFDVLAADSAAVIARHFIVNTRGMNAQAIGREK